MAGDSDRKEKVLKFLKKNGLTIGTFIGVLIGKLVLSWIVLHEVNLIIFSLFQV